MGFSYQGGANPAIDYPRLLISDTDPTSFIFHDSEIQAVANIEMGAWQSGQFYDGIQGTARLPSLPIPYRRIAATLLDALASNKSRLASVTQLLDVKLSPNLAAVSLRDQAQAYRDADDNSGAFVIIEQVNGPGSFRDRFWRTVQRANAA